MKSRLDNVLFAGFVAESVAKQVRHAAAGRQRFHVPRVTHVSDEADKVIFVRPHVPLRPTLLRRIQCQDNRPGLALDQFRSNKIQFFAQLRVMRVDPCKGGGVEPFADVLAVPSLPSGAFAITFQQTFRVEFGQAISLVRLNSRANPSAQSNAVRRLRVLPVGNYTCNFFRNGQFRGPGRRR